MGPFGSIDGGARFLPATAAPPLRRLSIFGGAKPLLSPPSTLVVGMGVPFDSEILSTDSGGCTDGDGWVLIIGADGFGVLSDGHRDKRSEVSRNVIILLFLPAFGAVIVVDVIDGDDVRGW